MTTEIEDLSGKKFNRWLVLERAPDLWDNWPVWACQCECGTAARIDATSLISGAYKSCGCEYRVPPLIYSTPEYRAWAGAIQRCYNPKSTGFKHYGGRGIRMCEEWRNDFLAFVSHIGPKPGEKYSIDRIDVNGDYRPGNVRWATPSQQANNTRRAIAARERRSRTSQRQRELAIEAALLISVPYRSP